MTTEIDALKTNEFIRRRKLRLQQVREQSKDIAKKIRQRANVEKLKQVSELDANKQKEYFRRQELLVKTLEEFYSKGIENVGASHRNASEVKLQGNQTEKADPSQQRGKEAAAKLRRKRQEKLDEQKKILDRKLQAREAANEVSREKSAAVLNKLLTKANKDLDIPSKDCIPEKDGNDGGDGSEVKCNDMATQWDLEPNEWEPNIPKLSLPNDDKDIKENNNNIESKSDKSRRLDLFALSEEMPSSLRGGLTTQEERVPVKPSLTLVSEYLQSRGLRLRQTDTIDSKKKNMDELHKLKQTILRTRAPNEVSAKGNSADKASKIHAAPKKNSVTMYNHSTRTERDVPCNDERLVRRDLQIDDDAYSQAMKESSTDNKEKDYQAKVQQVRSKIAMKKQDVEREYKDTISFLNSLPKDMGNKPIRRAYMDEDRQQSLRDNRQQKLQQEYKKIVKDCKKHSCRNKTRSKSKSPLKSNADFDSTDFQYSWMPVPESDDNLAIHTIPTSLKEGKSGNSVKFSKVDSYHEYRSRHQHTPPTKDTTQSKRFVEAVLIQNSSDSESASSEISSTDNIQLEKSQTSKGTEKFSDAERIIIYKILDSKNEKAKNSKVIKDIAKSLTFIEKQNAMHGKSHSKKSKAKKISSDSERRISFEELNEGVYKAVNENGTGDNIASMYYDKDGDKIELTEDEIKYGRPCCCSKTVGKDQLHEKGTTSLQWESGDNPPQVPRPSSTCSDCKCGCKNPPPPKLPKVIEENSGQQFEKQPSAATSTSSFKTASNDKASNALPDGGYIKLIDEGGEEAGKFYIGASGFLRDDAYEVVIQLRKKGDEKEVREIQTDLTKISEADLVNKASVSTATAVTATPETTEEVNTAHIPDEPKELNKSNRSNEVQDVVVNVVSEVPINRIDKNFSNESIEVLVNTQSRNVNVSEKCVSTSFQDTFAIPSHIPKSETMPRPATSTYTQTSMSSPNHRPVFFHMSSSTSTAYMSPPEMILPKFLRQDHRMSDDDLYDPRNFEMQDKIEVTDEHEYCEDYECKCKKCRHARKITLCRTNAHVCKKFKHRPGQTETPPNTSRSAQDLLDDMPITDSTSRENCQCRKCSSRNRLDKPVTSNSHVNKNKRITTSKQSSHNLMTRATTSSVSTHKDGLKRRNKPSLNPIIRDYVNKLLALSKEGLKAVQVVDQDCSSVATPGSSIINMPDNSNDKKPAIENKISLEQIKTMLKQQILDECEKKTNNDSEVCLRDHYNNNKKPKAPRKKTTHKVKSLNISKNLFRSKKTTENGPPQAKQTSSSSSMKEEHLKIPPLPSRSKIRSKSSPTPRSAPTHLEVMRSKTSTNVAPNFTKKPSNLTTKTSKSKNNINVKENKREPLRIESSGLSCHRATTTSMSPNSETSAPRQRGNNQETPSNMSTQTSNVDSEINFLRFDEDKIQNMEKIADLTEKCTKRLSNLAKVLEEVRRNKSLAYSQISTSEAASDSDQKSDKNANKVPANVYQTLHDTQKSLESKSPDTFAPVEEINENGNDLNSDDFVPFLNDIPKPDSFRTPAELNFSSSSSNKTSTPPPATENHLKCRGKPPPALSRIHLKHGHDYVIPHELSTVVEVDSPMSVKLKSQTSRNETKLDVPDSSNQIDNATYKADHRNEERYSGNPDLLVSNVDIPGQTRMLTTESSDDSKIHMIDMNQFNEIMLKPFFSLQEYAKNHNIGALDDGSNLEDFARGDIINDELSSLHSENSLPDVISELLKRNIISEPFKFDTQSNVNSSTISSESTLSVLALSKVRKEKKKSTMFQNKENIGETSDTLSISSNPDLENAFKMLGMGWASSTLKKTKERLALSSSSSSSSLSQFKIKSFNQDVPVLVSDTVSSVLNLSNIKQQKRNTDDTSKNAEQQTSMTNSMTVKEFLTNELAKKITFNNKSRNDTEEEFVSLFETKMPEEMKHTSRMVHEDSVDNSNRSVNNNRARTSTPVQLFKSMTYRSSSSSNVSNGLFSNADDLSSVKQTSNSMKHSTSDKDDLTIPNFSLRIKKGSSEYSKSD